MLILVFLFSLSLFQPGPLKADDRVSRSVVKIHATQNPPDFFRPWMRQNPQEMIATGVVIEGNKILTNAHVVAFASQIYIQSYQSADRVPARVAAAAPGVDLALLTAESSFFESCPALPFASKLPKAKDSVTAYGYPLGGQDLSITEGIVSRIVYAPMHFNMPCLQVQIDAALNPGNSGGPAVSKGKMIGLVSSKIMKAENIGYIIPIEEVEMFLKDIADGTYDGQPQIQGVGMQTTENSALRSWLKLEKGQSGIMVDEVSSSDQEFPLKPFDVITHIGDYALDNEGQVRVSGDLRLPATYLVPRLARNGKVDARMVCNGVAQKVAIPVSTKSRRVIRFTGLEYPRYFIYGPLVFSPITEVHVHYLGQSEKIVPYLIRSGNPIATRFTDMADPWDEELVSVVSPLFPHKVSKGYEAKILGIIRQINGVKVKNLVHLATILRDCRDEYLVFKFFGTDNETLVFRRDEIEAATEEILTEYGVRYQYSPDLKAVWEKPKANEPLPDVTKKDDT